MSCPASRRSTCSCRYQNHPKIRQMVTMMAEDPARWQTLSQWAAVFAMSERNLARPVVRETG